MLPYNFGLEQYLGLGLYAAGILAFVLSIFWRPLAGICYLVPLIPLQTTRYRMMQYPLGATVVSLILLAVAVGLLRRRQWILPRTPFTFVICLYALYNLASLFLNLENVGPRLKEWWDYMMMPLLFFLVAAAVEDTKQIKLIVVLMCAAALVLDKSFWNTVSDRDYSTFSRDLQEGGAMGYAGVQGLAAFNAQYAWFLVALAGGWRNRWFQLGSIALALFAANCVMYSFSRGGYVAVLAGWFFIGLVKRRKLLVLLALFGISWASLVPNAVRERVLMTYDPEQGELDHSAQLRVELWTDAMEMFQSSPILGTGFNTYAYMKRVHDYADTHNIYLKVLVETGIVGLLLFLWLLGKTFLIGWKTFRRVREPFYAALGLGLAAWIVCTAVANLFGDRWTYLQINGYLWVLAGLVSRALVIESEEKFPSQDDARLVKPVLVPVA
jgi:putative inorganic carbon (hco3(-)) transporter